MADSVTGPARDAPSKEREEEVSSGGEIVQAVVKAARGLTIYPPGSPFHERFLGELHARLSRHLAHYGALASPGMTGRRARDDRPKHPG
jgi:hypothetical protein